MLRFIIFIILFIILVRVISNLFLRGSKKKSSNARFFYQAFKNIRDQQNDQQQHQQQSHDEINKDSFDDIEEADYEDVTEEETKTSTKH
jgi:hypothetical protein